LFKAVLAQDGNPIGLIAPERPPSLHSTWASALVQWLSELGCEVAYCLPGRHIDRLLAALEQDSEIRLLTARHELTAAFMALGAARLTQRPTLVASIGGPGAQMMLAVARSALQDQVPVIFLTGSDDADEFQSAACDGASFAALGVTSIRIDLAAPASAFATVARRLRAGDPVHVQINDHTLQADSGVTFPPFEPGPQLHEAILPVEGCILLAAHCSVSEFAPQWRSIAKDYGLRTASTLLARGVFDEQAPNHLGHLGIGENRETALALTAASQVLVLDGHWESCTRQLARLWCAGRAEGWRAVRSENWHLLRQRESAVPLVADQEKVAVLPRARVGTGKPERSAQSCARPAEEHRVRPIRSTASEPSSALAVSARAVFTAVWQNLPPRHSLFVDAGELRRAACELALVNDAADLLLCEREAPMGFALSASIGASFAQGERAVVALMGDGSFLMHAAELATAAAARLPLVVVVHQNGSLGAPAERARGQSWSKHCLLPEFDPTALAQSLGVEAELLSSPASLGSALRSALCWTQRNARPYLISVRWRQS